MTDIPIEDVKAQALALVPSLHSYSHDYGWSVRDDKPRGLHAIAPTEDAAWREALQHAQRRADDREAQRAKRRKVAA